MIRLLPDEHRRLADYIYEISAISLDISKSYLIEGRLSQVAESAGCCTLTDLISKAQSDVTGRYRRSIINAITTNETSFFRDTSPFELLRHKLLPEFIERRTRTGSVRPLRVWSAACSTGQEVYTIAIVLKETLGDLDKYGVRILGTDISDDALARAKQGVYNQVEMTRGLVESSMSRYFLKADDGWKVRDDLRAKTNFRSLNLKDDFSWLGRFDLIFCRNVAIYFNDQDRTSLFERISRQLDSGGSLIVGSMENLARAARLFDVHRHQGTVYYTVKAMPAA